MKSQSFAEQKTPFRAETDVFSIFHRIVSTLSQSLVYWYVVPRFLERHSFPILKELASFKYERFRKRRLVLTIDLAESSPRLRWQKHILKRSLCAKFCQAKNLTWQFQLLGLATLGLDLRNTHDKDTRSLVNQEGSETVEPITMREVSRSCSVSENQGVRTRCGTCIW